MANSLNVRQFGAVGTFVRADNAISYFLPAKVGGVYGQVMVAASESGVVNGGRYIGGRVGFAAGPFDVSAAAAEQRVDATGGKVKTYNVGGSFDFGVVKVLGYFNRDTLDLPISRRDNRGGISAVVPMGQGEIHAGYSRGKLASSGSPDNTVSQFGLGYVYSLSKRTAVYTNVARLSNGGLSVNTVNGSGSGGAGPTAGGKSVGAEFGVRHFF